MLHEDALHRLSKHLLPLLPTMPQSFGPNQDKISHEIHPKPTQVWARGLWEEEAGTSSSYPDLMSL